MKKIEKFFKPKPNPKPKIVHPTETPPQPKRPPSEFNKLLFVAKDDFQPSFSHQLAVINGEILEVIDKTKDDDMKIAIFEYTRSCPSLWIYCSNKDGQVGLVNVGNVGEYLEEKSARQLLIRRACSKYVQLMINKENTIEVEKQIREAVGEHTEMYIFCATTLFSAMETCSDEFIDLVCRLSEKWFVNSKKDEGREEFQSRMTECRRSHGVFRHLSAKINGALSEDWRSISSGQEDLVNALVDSIEWDPNCVPKIVSYFFTKLEVHNQDHILHRNTIGLCTAITERCESFATALAQRGKEWDLCLARQIELEKAVPEPPKRSPTARCVPLEQNVVFRENQALQTKSPSMDAMNTTPVTPKRSSFVQISAQGPSADVPATDNNSEVTSVPVSGESNDLVPSLPIFRRTDTSTSSLAQRLSLMSERLFSVVIPSIRKYTRNEVKVLGNIGHGAEGLAQKVRTPDSPTVKVMKKFDERQITFVDQTIREFVKLIECGHHEHIVQIYGMVFIDKEKEEHPVGIIMEYMECGALHYTVHGEDKYGELEVLEWSLQIASALRHLHLNGLIHRDLKPGNILVSEVCGQKIMKLADFGMAKRSKPDAPNSQGGTPAYAAPELRDETPCGPPVDIYSFGITIWELAQRKAPFHPENLVFVDEAKTITRPSLADPKYSWLPGVVQRMWNQDPKLRPTIEEAYAEINDHYLFLSAREENCHSIWSLS